MLVGLGALCGCSKDRYRVVEGCFEPFEVEVGDSQHIWPLGGNAGDDELIAHGFVGYLASMGASHSKKTLPGDARLQLTGRMVQSHPTVAERRIGGSQRGVVPEARVGGVAYLLIEPLPSWEERVAAHCRVETAD